MNLLPDIESWLIQQGETGPFSCSAVHGGSICDSWLITSAGKQSFFAKTLNNAPEGLFAAEVAGLQAIRTTNSLPTPAVYHHTEHFLIMEYLPARQKAPDYWEQLAKQLAQMHSVNQSHFGFYRDTYCGKTLQPNRLNKDGHVFFAEQRLLYQTALAYDAGLLQQQQVTAMETLCQRLTELIPVQPASLLHGDLWSGNLHIYHNGQPAIIDPACYWGWAEADLAMTRLFGGFTNRFYDCYLAHSPIDHEWSKRTDLYNLYHLLNHLNLFGGSYLQQVTAIIKRYQ